MAAFLPVVPVAFAGAALATALVAADSAAGAWALVPAATFAAPAALAMTFSTTAWAAICSVALALERAAGAFSLLTPVAALRAGALAGAALAAAVAARAAVLAGALLAAEAGLAGALAARALTGAGLAAAWVADFATALVAARALPCVAEDRAGDLEAALLAVAALLLLFAEEGLAGAVADLAEAFVGVFNAVFTVDRAVDLAGVFKAGWDVGAAPARRTTVLSCLAMRRPLETEALAGVAVRPRAAVRAEAVR